MNSKRRSQIKKIAKAIRTLSSQLDELKSEEESAKDNLPESLQYSEKGDAMEQAIEYFDEAIEKLDEAADQLENIE